ncbi:response regulator [Prosthecobacter vanneervenii]|uniref:Two-component system copper resistance phosphate regulon response regulator CusR n=1 Tax=Prosthecobacter vanneervenii TaxID=48466 RepID=A0A7W8DMS9_9BACT|nr:response regulator transcription factor [Prosthecobacter vanneervenii]MBB5035375.1 two-component system copper resistance phosphate regulon response regulator CusR [Prosthecobacter vanneervenii]
MSFTNGIAAFVAFMRLLVVEDETKVARFIERGLREEGFTVETAGDGDSGLAKAREGTFDLIILDVMLPQRDGFSVLRALRSVGVCTRVLMLTARDGVVDRVQGLDLGADDYLVKPFAFAELLARVRALLRRSLTEEQALLHAADVQVDLRARRVTRGGKLVTLSSKEFGVLAHLLRRAGSVVTRSELAETVWEDLPNTPSNVIEVTVYHLREKIDRGFSPALIQTVRGAGYLLQKT